MVRIRISAFYFSVLGTRRRSLESQPINLLVKSRNTSAGNPFVNKSANCSLVSTLRTLISPVIYWQKKWYLIAICLVQMLIFVGFVASARAPLLSSHTRVFTTDLVEKLRLSLVPTSSKRLRRGNNAHIACNKVMYLASVVLRAISVCSFEDQNNGHPLSNKTKPI